jgi:hypothetical protein
MVAKYDRQAASISWHGGMTDYSDWVYHHTDMPKKIGYPYIASFDSYLPTSTPLQIDLGVLSFLNLSPADFWLDWSWRLTLGPAMVPEVRDLLKLSEPTLQEAGFEPGTKRCVGLYGGPSLGLVRPNQQLLAEIS